MQPRLTVGDTLTNLVSGMGTDKDKLSQGQFTQQWLGKNELDSMYQSDWLAGTIIDAPCDDMTREWRFWKGGPRQIQAIEQAERRFQVRQKVNKALKMSRLYGGAAILIGDGSPDPMQPLDASRIGKGGLQYIHVLSRYEISTGDLDRDPLSLFFGEPQYYTLGGASGGATIHPSRVIRFFGQARLESTWAIDGWGLPTLQRVYDAIRAEATVAGNLAALTNEAKLDIIHIPDLTKNVMNPTYRAAIITRFGLVNQSKSINNALILDAEEKWDQKEIRLGEMPNTLRLFLEIAAGAANMPVTRLLGMSAKGLNATGESDIRHYYDTLSARQEIELRPALERLDDALVRSALGSYPSSLSYLFNPLWQLSDAEKAAVGLQKAQTTQIYAQLGIMAPDALRKAAQGQIVEDNLYPGMEAILQDNPGPAAPLNPVAASAKPADPGKVVEGIASNSRALSE